MYEAMRRQAIERLEQSPEANQGQQRMQLLAEIMRLRRACCHPQLALPDSELPSAKLDAFAEIVEELLENRHKPVEDRHEVFQTRRAGVMQFAGQHDERFPRHHQAG